jgi:hypothetical protein
MGDDDQLTSADKEALLIAAGWVENTEDGKWYHGDKLLIRETLEDAYACEFPPEEGKTEG